MRTEDMAATVQGFGADTETLYFFEQDRPELLPYATLQTARRNGDAACRTVDAVCEWQGTPLAFLVDADSVDDTELRRVRRLLAMRGDAPYLGVVAPGSLRVFRIALDGKSLRQARVDLPNGPVKGAAFSQLANLRPGQAIAQRKWISSVVLRLLTGSMRELITLKISGEDAISLVGRALFTRFLADRDLLPEGMSGQSTSAHLFDTPHRAQTTSDWLDATFNGDLLPLSKGIFDRLPPSGLRVLGHVLRRALDGQLSLGWQEKWDNLDFAHIPVGVLSQAYELYMRDHAPRKQRREGGYFTPQPIAELMVQASFRGLQRQGNAKTAKVLDPAAGAGMFLLTAFRELVAEHWRSDGSRPDTDTLRRILYSQLVGFDINEGALRFAALGLYLLSIELDPEPRPVDKLGFDDLRGKVLHRVTEPGEAKGKELGSLGPAVGAKHANRYDLVIGNPPWASSTQLPGWRRVREKVAHIAAQRGREGSPPRLPNEGLDLPFVWRAMEWAKPSGQIAFALHARLLFQQGDGMPDARQALFDALDVTSVINGAELRQTQVWPQVSAPFCVIFAANRTPGVEAGFRFVSPRLEGSLNGAGNMRIDAINAEVVAPRQLRETPDVLKVLFRGSNADLGIRERIRAQGHPTLEEFWRERIGVARGRMRGSGSGYQTLRPSSRPRVAGDGLPGVDATYLHGLPEYAPTSDEVVVVDSEQAHMFSQSRLHDPRARELFGGPLLVVRKSAQADVGRVQVAVSDHDLVYNETYYGYSTGPHPHARALARHMALVLGSRFAMWLALMTSGEFGVEREVIEKATLDRTPIPDFDKLEEFQRGQILELFESLNSGEASWNDVDKWVADLYGLDERDLQTISDTLEFNLPFKANKRNAQMAPTDTSKVQFCQALEDELTPWCERFGSTLAVEHLPSMEALPWHAISVRAVRRGPVQVPPMTTWAELISEADTTAASEIILEIDSNQLLIGRLAQRRYWSKTQARLLAQRIAWSHVGTLKGHGTE